MACCDMYLLHLFYLHMSVKAIYQQESWEFLQLYIAKHEGCFTLEIVKLFISVLLHIMSLQYNGNVNLCEIPLSSGVS